MIRVTRFKAGTHLVVEEVLTGQLADQYEADETSISYSIPKYATYGNVGFTNKWLYRDFEVSKNVLTGDPEANVSEIPFTMVLEISADGSENGYVPAAGIEYQLFNSAGERIMEDQTLKTGADGSFTIYGSTTARFISVAKEGAAWRVKELVDDTYEPLIPAELDATEKYTAWQTGVLGTENNTTFVNGNGGILILRKNWIADDEGSAAIFENSGYPGAYFSIDYSVSDYTVPIEVLYATSGTSVSYNSYYFSIPGQSSRSISVPTYISIYGPEDYVIFKLHSSVENIGAISFSDWDFRITETNWYQSYYIDQNWMPEYAGRTLVFNAGLKSEDFDIYGTPGETPELVFENHASLLASSVIKRLRGECVPAGKKLVWRVERFNGSTWEPAEGVNYVLESMTRMMAYPYGNNSAYPFYSGDDNTGPLEDIPVPVESRSDKTGPDGLIEIVTTDNFYGGDKWDGYGAE